MASFNLNNLLKGPTPNAVTLGEHRNWGAGGDNSVHDTGLPMRKMEFFFGRKHFTELECEGKI